MRYQKDEEGVRLRWKRLTTKSFVEEQFCNHYQVATHARTLTIERIYLCTNALWTLSGCRLEWHCTTSLDRHAGVLGNAPVFHKCGGARGPTLRKLIAPEVVAGVEKWFFSAEAK